MTRRCGDCRHWTGEPGDELAECFGAPPPVVEIDGRFRTVRPVLHRNDRACGTFHQRETGFDVRTKP